MSTIYGADASVHMYMYNAGMDRTIELYNHETVGTVEPKNCRTVRMVETVEPLNLRTM